VGDLHNYWGADAALAHQLRELLLLLRHQRRRPPKTPAAGGLALLGVSHCGGVTAAARTQRPRLLMAEARTRVRERESVTGGSFSSAFRGEKSPAR